MLADTLLKFAIITSGICTLVILIAVAIIFSLVFLNDDDALEFRSKITDFVAAPLGRISVESSNNVLGSVDFIRNGIDKLFGPEQNYTVTSNRSITTDVSSSDWGLKLHVAQFINNLASELRCEHPSPTSSTQIGCRR